MGLSVQSVGGGPFTYDPVERTGGGSDTSGSVTPAAESPAQTDTYVPGSRESPSFAPAYGPSGYRSRPPPESPGSSPGSGGGSVGDPSPLVGGPRSGEDSKAVGSHECRTCAERKYQDGSNDPGVSFKSATHVSPETAAIAVSSHEAEHVSREQMKAKADHRSVVSQFVRIHTDVCPECGRVYVSGGTTTTITRSAPETPQSRGINVTV